MSANKFEGKEELIMLQINHLFAVKTVIDEYQLTPSDLQEVYQEVWKRLGVSVGKVNTETMEFINDIEHDKGNSGTRDRDQ